MGCTLDASILCVKVYQLMSFWLQTEDIYIHLYHALFEFYRVIILLIISYI